MLRVGPGASVSFLLSRLRPLLPPPPARGRKSRHDPPAKSKAGRVNVPPPVDPEELWVVRERYRQYKEMVRALSAEFQENVLQKVCEERSGTLAAERAKQEMDEHRLLMAWNDAENARKRIIREERMQQEQKKEEEQRLHAAIYLETLQKQILQEKTREVLQLQEEAKHFITKENLDQRIEAALDNPKNYNFSVDKEGRVAKRTALS